MQALWLRWLASPSTAEQACNGISLYSPASSVAALEFNCSLLESACPVALYSGRKRLCAVFSSRLARVVVSRAEEMLWISRPVRRRFRVQAADSTPDLDERVNCKLFHKDCVPSACPARMGLLFSKSRPKNRRLRPGERNSTTCQVERGLIE